VKISLKNRRKKSDIHDQLVSNWRKVDDITLISCLSEILSMVSKAISAIHLTFHSFELRLELMIEL